MDNTKEHTIKHLALCSGYDGVGLGLKKVVGNVRDIAHVEIEAFCVARLVAKMESGEITPAPIFTNLKEFPFAEFRECVDLLSAGFPCQPFSAAGKRRATEDPRHLWPFIEKGIGECRPKLVLLENVEGIISAKTGDGESVLKYVLRGLESLDYEPTAGVFSAAEMGKRHLRKRVFILAIDRREMGYAKSWRNRYDTPEQQGWDSSSRPSAASEELVNSNNDGLPRYTIGSEESEWGTETSTMPRSPQNRLADSNSSGSTENIELAKLRSNRTIKSPSDSGGSESTERGKEHEDVGDSERAGLKGILHGSRQGEFRGSDTRQPRTLANTESGGTRRITSSDGSEGATFVSSSESDERRNDVANIENIGCRGGSDRDDTNSCRIQKSEEEIQSNLRSETERCSRDARSEWYRWILNGAIKWEMGAVEQLKRANECEVARPNEPQHEWEAPRVLPKLEKGKDATQSYMGRTTHGIANRVDRLRLLGNGISPDTCSRAFATLIKRLIF